MAVVALQGVEEEHRTGCSLLLLLLLHINHQEVEVEGHQLLRLLLSTNLVGEVEELEYSKEVVEVEVEQEYYHLMVVVVVVVEEEVYFQLLVVGAVVVEEELREKYYFPVVQEEEAVVE